VVKEVEEAVQKPPQVKKTAEEEMAAMERLHR
jgi:hypothetical protein